MLRTVNGNVSADDVLEVPVSARGNLFPKDRRAAYRKEDLVRLQEPREGVGIQPEAPSRVTSEVLDLTSVATRSSRFRRQMKPGAHAFGAVSSLRAEHQQSAARNRSESYRVLGHARIHACTAQRE